jgi:hypothetical protein
VNNKFGRMMKGVVRAQLEGPFRRGGSLAIRPILEAEFFGISQKLFFSHLLEKLIQLAVVSLDTVRCFR